MSEFTDRLAKILVADMKGYVICVTPITKKILPILHEVLREAEKTSTSPHFNVISDSRLVYLNAIYIDFIPENRLDIVLIEKDVPVIYYEI